MGSDGSDVKWLFGAEGWHLRRLVRVEGEPLLVLEGYLPCDLGLSITEGALTIAARVASPPEAVSLGVETGAALLQVTRVIRGRAGRPLEWSRALYRSDRYHYEVELRRR